MGKLMNVEAAAERLATTERHVRELIYREEIPYLKVGRLVRFDADDLDAWLETRRIPSRE